MDAVATCCVCLLAGFLFLAYFLGAGSSRQSSRAPGRPNGKNSDDDQVAALRRVHPPEPTGAWPVVGHLPLLGASKEATARTLGRMADQYGPVFMLRLGAHRTLVISSPEAARDCFTTCDRNFASRPRGAGGKYLFYDHSALPLAPYGPRWLEWLDLRGYIKAMKRTSKVLDAVLVNWIDEHRQRKKTKKGDNKSGDAEGEHLDFVDVMLSSMPGVDLAGLNIDTAIKATVLAMISGGRDTSAVTMTWALALLLNHRPVLDKLRRELDLHVGDTRNVEEKDIQKLTYLHAVVKETMRLYPAGPLSVPHEATADCLVHGFELETPAAAAGGAAPVDMGEGLGLVLTKAAPLEILITPRLSPHLYHHY